MQVTFSNAPFSCSSDSGCRRIEVEGGGRFPAVTGGDGVGDESFGLRDGVRERETAGEAGGDGGGVGATGAMGVGIADEIGNELTGGVWSDEQIHGLASFEVSALAKKGNAKFFDEGASGLFDFGQVPAGLAAKNAEFVEVGSDQRSAGEKEAFVGGDGGIFQ